MTRILLVEDDEALSRGLGATLRSIGYAVDVARDGETALLCARDEPYTLITLDLGLPDMSGLAVLEQLRREGNRTPVLILSARDAIEDRVKGLDLGADDYLLKPFDPSELTARIRALLRRSQGVASSVVRIGALTVDHTSTRVMLGETDIPLRRREWAVLDRLVAHVGKVVSKDRLTAEVFGYDEPVATNAVEVYVGRLRRKFEPDGPEIRTIRGLGYMLVAR